MANRVFDTSPQLKKAVDVQHGALNYKELESLGVSPAHVLDFSSNINPFGPPPGLQESLLNIDISSYPDRDAIALRKVLSRQIGVDLSQVVVGNGTAELIWLIAFAFVQPGNKTLIIGPTFGEYQRCASLMGAQVSFVNARSEEQFDINYKSVEQALKINQPELCFICNPNNPTGKVLPLEIIQSWAKKYPQTGFIIDEAYLPFTPEFRSAIMLGMPNVVVLRSMTKDYSIAGLRLGYAVGSKEVIEKIEKIRPAWNVNSFAQAAGLAALDQINFMPVSNQKIRQEKEILVKALEEFDYFIPSSKTHFFIIDVKDAKDFRARLLHDHSIQVRDCTSFGLSSFVRISTRQRGDNQRLISAIRDINSHIKLGKVLS